MLVLEVSLARLLWMLLALESAGWAMQARIEPVELCERSELVVIGEITSFDARWAADKDGAIERVFDLSVERVLRGPTPQGPVRVIVPGGDLGANLRYIVEDSPELLVDHRYLLLLAPDADGWRVVGLQQGAFPLDHAHKGDAALLASLGSCLAN